MEIIEKESIKPKQNIIPIYKGLFSVSFIKRLKIPQFSEESKDAPLKKKAANTRLIVVRILISMSDR